MSPRLGEIEELRAVLLAARKANAFGRGQPDEKLQQIVPLIDALARSMAIDIGTEALFHQLMQTLRLVPVYPPEPSMGSEPIAMRWVVAKPEPFHRCVELLRQRFPDVSEFK